MPDEARQPWPRSHRCSPTGTSGKAWVTGAGRGASPGAMVSVLTSSAPVRASSTEIAWRCTISGGTTLRSRTSIEYWPTSVPAKRPRRITGTKTCTAAPSPGLAKAGV